MDNFCTRQAVAIRDHSSVLSKETTTGSPKLPLLLAHESLQDFGPWIGARPWMMCPACWPLFLLLLLVLVLCRIRGEHSSK